jgi:hypothetical protein
MRVRICVVLQPLALFYSRALGWVYVQVTLRAGVRGVGVDRS